MLWRILHGAVAVNAFVSVLNPDVSSPLLFCTCFLFSLMKLFQQTFIFVFKYVQKQRHKCQLIHFFLGQAKMAIYVSRKNKVEQMSSQDVVLHFSILVRSCILIDFRFDKAMKNLESSHVVTVVRYVKLRMIICILQNF